MRLFALLKILKVCVQTLLIEAIYVIKCNVKNSNIALPRYITDDIYIYIIIEGFAILMSQSISSFDIQINTIQVLSLLLRISFTLAIRKVKKYKAISKGPGDS